jgi:hypothetical protein
LLNRGQIAPFPDPAMLSFLTRAFDITVVALIFVGFS